MPNTFQSIGFKHTWMVSFQKFDQPFQAQNFFPGEPCITSRTTSVLTVKVSTSPKSLSASWMVRLALLVVTLCNHKTSVQGIPVRSTYQYCIQMQRISCCQDFALSSENINFRLGNLWLCSHFPHCTKSSLCHTDLFNMHQKKFSTPPKPKPSQAQPPSQRLL